MAPFVAMAAAWWRGGARDSQDLQYCTAIVKIYSTVQYLDSAIPRSRGGAAPAWLAQPGVGPQRAVSCCDPCFKNKRVHSAHRHMRRHSAQAEHQADSGSAAEGADRALRRGSVDVSASCVARGLLAELEHGATRQRKEIAAVESALAIALEGENQARHELSEERRLRERVEARLRAQTTLQVHTFLGTCVMSHGRECQPFSDMR